jgi:superfamily II DNA or RNA helicase
MSDSPEFDPRSYQINARDQIVHQLENEGRTFFLVLLPTGMGKTLIATLTVEMLIERGAIADDEKVLFLVQDRKLKHQLHEMATKYGLGNYGHLYLLDEQKGIPAAMSRQHAAISKFIFATPVLMMNAIVGRSARIDQETLGKIRLIIIDEIFDIFAQSYGTKRPRDETISYIERRFGNGRDFNQIVSDLKRELEAQGQNLENERIVNLLVTEFEGKNYRMNKRFEPLLNVLGTLSSESNKIMIGLTASISQEAKIDLFKTTFSGDRVVEIHPIGDDFESYRPAYELKRIRVFDDWITKTDVTISNARQATFTHLSKAYTMLTGRKTMPKDRILLFVSDLLGKENVRTRLLERLGGNKESLMSILSNASAYLLLTVARQRLLEATFDSFQKFIEEITNKTLLSNKDFLTIKEEVRKKREQIAASENYLGEKEKRLLFWLDMLKKEQKKALVMCRFVEVTKYLSNLAEKQGIQSTFVHGGMDGATQHKHIKSFKEGDRSVLFASERLIEKGTDLPEADVGFYYGTTASLERYEQSLGRIRSNVSNVKTLYTIAYNQTVEDEKSLKRDTMFLELLGKKMGSITIATEE